MNICLRNFLFPRMVLRARSLWLEIRPRLTAKLKALLLVHDKKYILYVRTSCAFCKKAEELLIEKKEDYFIVPFDTQPEALAHMKWAYSQETVPIIFKREGASIEFIGGYSDLVKHFDG